MNNKQIENLEGRLSERYELAKKTDAMMGNEDGQSFLPNNPDFLFYLGMVESVNCLGLEWERITENGEVRHIIYK